MAHRGTIHWNYCSAAWLKYQTARPDISERSWEDFCNNVKVIYTIIYKLFASLWSIRWHINANEIFCRFLDLVRGLQCCATEHTLRYIAHQNDGYWILQIASIFLLSMAMAPRRTCRIRWTTVKDTGGRQVRRAHYIILSFMRDARI